MMSGNDDLRDIHHFSAETSENQASKGRKRLLFLVFKGVQLFNTT